MVLITEQMLFKFLLSNSPIHWNKAIESTVIWLHMLNEKL